MDGQPTKARMTPGALLKIIRRYWLIPVITTLVFASLAYVYASRQQKVYEAHGDVFFNLSVSDNAGSSDPARAARTQAALALSGIVIDKAAAALHVPSQTVAANVDVIPSSEANQLTFSGRSTDPSVAVRLVAAMQTAYNAVLTGNQSGDSNTTVSAITALRGKLQSQLNSVQSQIAAGSGNQATLQTQRDNLTSEISALDSREADAVVGAALSGTPIVYRPSQASQIAPTPTRTALLGAVVGLLVGIGLVAWRVSRDNSQPSSGFAETAIGAPVLAEMRKPRKRRRGGTTWTATAEADLALSVALAMPEHARVVALLPATAGITPLVATRLVSAITSGGHSVLLVDGDLHKGRLSRDLLPGARQGLIDAAAGVVSIDQCVLTGMLHSERFFQFLPSGRLGAAGALNRSSVTRLLGDLRARLDLTILVDGPVTRYGVSRAVSELADAVIVCWDGDDREALEDTAAALATAGCLIVGVLIDRTEGVGKSAVRFNVRSGSQVARPEPAAPLDVDADEVWQATHPTSVLPPSA